MTVAELRVLLADYADTDRVVVPFPDALGRTYATPCVHRVFVVPDIDHWRAERRGEPTVVLRPNVNHD